MASEIALSPATCEVLVQILLESPLGKALLKSVCGEHGLDPNTSVAVKLTGSLTVLPDLRPDA